MAKDYEKFKAEWTKIKKEVGEALAEINSNAQLVSQTSGIMSEGAKELGKRVQELKDTGQKGDELKDFIADKEVKQMADRIDDFLESMEKELKKIDALHKGNWAKTKLAKKALVKELAEEIKTRKKATSTKLGVGNKSLPNMEALAKEIDKYDGTFTTFEVFVPETIAQHRKEVGFKIQDEIRKAKDVRLTEYQAMMMEQGLNTRHMKTNFGKAKTIYDSIGKEKQNAETAQRERKANDLTEAQRTAKELFAQLAEIVAPYEKAPKDEWVRSKYQASKDRATIENGIKAFIDMRTKAAKVIEEIDDVKIG